MMFNPAIRSSFPPPAVTAEKADLIGVQDIVRFLRASYRIILGWTFAFAALGIVFCLVVTPSFTGTAQVLIETDHIQSFFQDTPSRPDTETETGRIESQIEVIKSDRIAEVVIRKLKLLGDAEFSPPADPPFYAPALDAIKAMVKAPEPPLTEEDARIARTNIALERFKDRLSVRRIGQSFVAEVTFRSNDAAKAAAITNALLDAYIEADVEAKASNARRGNVWLTERLEELRSQVTEARRAVEEFKSSGDIQSLSERAVRLAELESLSQSRNRLYDVFLQRFMETAQKITYPVPDARIIATAAKPLSRSFPKTGLIVAFMGLLGAAAGVGIGMVRLNSDHSIRSAQQIVTKLDCPVLGAVTTRPRRGTDGLGVHAQLLCAIAAAGRPQTPFVSELRALKVTVNTAILSRPFKRIGITSVGQGEGKTTVACNLGALFACSGSRVLLIDLCDGAGSLGRALAPDARADFSELAKSPDALARSLVPCSATENLYVLPLGTFDGLASPAEQLASNNRRSEMEALGQAFDLIVFDLPGIEESSDARAIAPFLNAVIVVVEYGRTSIEALRSAVDRLRDSHTEILGVVINKVDPKRKDI